MPVKKEKTIHFWSLFGVPAIVFEIKRGNSTFLCGLKENKPRLKEKGSGKRPSVLTQQVRLDSQATGQRAERID